MYERFTDRARKVMQLANGEAQRLNHEYIGTEHILLGLVKEGGGVAANVLKNLDIDLRKVRLEIEKIVQTGPEMVNMGKLPQTPRAKKVLEYAVEEARNLNHNYVGTEHLLLGLIREMEGVASQVLMNLGLNLEDVREEVLKILGHDVELSKRPQGAVSVAQSGGSKSRNPALDSFGRDLTDQARKGQLDPVIGREDEIARIILVLGCRKQNNPLLVGDVGVGKTAIVEGLAQQMARGVTADWLRDRRLVQVHLSTLAAGLTEYAQLRERMEALVNELRKAKDVLLTIGDLTGLAGTNTQRLAVTMGAVLTTALAQAEVQCIARCTPGEYQTLIAGDNVFARCFRPIFVSPPSPEQAQTILGIHMDVFESHHKVQVASDVPQAVIELTERYLPDRCLPGKAVQVIDEACALVRFRSAPRPPDLSELVRQIEQLTLDKESAVAAGDFEKAASLRDQADRLKKEREKVLLLHEQRAQRVIGTVDKEAVAEVIRMMTGRPV